MGDPHEQDALTLFPVKIRKHELVIFSVWCHMLCIPHPALLVYTLHRLGWICNLKRSVPFFPGITVHVSVSGPAFQLNNSEFRVNQPEQNANTLQNTNSPS